VLLAPFAVRGFWRGFCREAFGLAGLVLGVVVAAAATAPLSGALAGGGSELPWAARATIFVAVFLGVVLAANVLGGVADRIARALFLGGLNRLAGILFGSLKGGAALGFGLLLAERFAPSPALAHAIARSTLGRPLVALAAEVLEAGRVLSAPPGKAA
jgi:membrane protein required for colicin V production